MKSLNGHPFMNKILVAIVSGVMLLTSCGTPAVTPTPALSTAGGADPYAGLNLVIPEVYDPPIEMTSVISVDATVKFTEGNDINDNIWTRAYRDLLGIDISYQWVVDASMYDQKLGLSVNSGDIPDVFKVSPAQLSLYQEAGLIEDLSSVFDAEASANTMDILNQDPVALKSATIDGKLWGIPLTDASVATAAVLWIRQDWMEKQGIQAPTSMQDVLEIARRFTEEDPDGNGVADTIGLCIDKDLFGAIGDLAGFFNGYHAYPRIWYERDGELVYGSVQPEMRAGLLALQSMYAAGEIDQEFGVKDVNAMSETIANGKCGMEYGAWWNPYHPLNLSQANNPDAYWAAFAVPSADSQPAFSQYTSAIGSFLVVRKGYEHPEALIRMVNFWTDNLVGSESDAVRQMFLGDINNPDVVLYKYTPVVLWEPNAAIDAGTNLREALANHDPSGLNLEGQWRYRIIQAYFEQGIKEAWVEVATNGPNGSSSILLNIAKEGGMLNQFYGPPTPTMATTLPTLQSMESEMITKVIMGQPISLFDEFVQNWSSMGGTEIGAEVNAWYVSNQ